MPAREEKNEMDWKQAVLKSPEHIAYFIRKDGRAVYRRLDGLTVIEREIGGVRPAHPWEVSNHENWKPKILTHGGGVIQGAKRGQND